MTEKQLFGVLVRGAGVLVSLSGANNLWNAFLVWVWQDSIVGQGHSFPPMFGGQNFIYALAVLVLGLSMIRWPDWIVRIAWPQDLEKEPSAEL